MPDPMNATIAAAAPLPDLVSRAWELLTSRGYASRAARRIIQRRLREAGYRFYIFLPDDGPSQWGIFAPGETLPSDSEGLLYVGVTLDHCAHQMGFRDARLGWIAFWQWN